MEANYVHKDSTTLVQDKFIKNGVFSLEYDKETLRDMVLELQEDMIYSIVTHEQMEQMAYKVGSNNVESER